MTREYTLTGNLKLKPVWSEDFSATVISDRAIIVNDVNLNSADENNYVDAHFKDQVDVDTTASELDLTSLTHKAFGDSGTIALENVLVIYLENKSETQDITIFGGSTDAWDGFSSGSITMKPGGVLYATAPGSGWPVTSTAKKIELQASAAGAKLDVFLVGVIDE